MVLFSPLTGIGWLDAEFRRSRVSAARVVAINLDRSQMVTDERIALTLVSGRADAAFLAQEIRGARQAVVSPGPAATAAR